VSAVNEIYEKNIKASISPLGGTIQGLQINGVDVLYPLFKTSDGKMRGGMPMCAPWFGNTQSPLDESLPKHGLLRHLKPKSVGFQKTHTIEMEFEDEENREKYSWNLKYLVTASVDNNSLKTLVRITRVNDGLFDRAPVNFGFHPYFAVTGKPEDVKVTIGADTHKGFSDKSKMIPLTSTSILIQQPNREIVMSLIGFPVTNSQIVLWSDAPEKYFCVEPILDDPKNFGTKNGFFLDIGQTMDFFIIITVL
jgi:galactose mutarotase-like enzyme